MSQPTSNEKEAIKFFNPSGARGRRIKFDYETKWKGDHRECRQHRDGFCVTPQGWMPTASGVVMPDLVPVSIEENAMTTLKQEGVKGAYAEPVWKAKGWLDPQEATGVRPTVEVLTFIIEQQVKAHKITIESRGAKYDEVERETTALRAKLEAANGIGIATKGKGKAADG